MVVNALAHRFSYAISCFVERAAYLVLIEERRPILLHLYMSIRMHDHRMRRRQFVNAFEKGFRKRTELKAEVLLKSLAIELAFVGWMFEDALYLRCEDELFLLNGVVERFDAEEIACTEQDLLLLVPDREGEHATNAVQYFFSPGNIACE